jgi:predicted Ser/Thr protein kinase
MSSDSSRGGASWPSYALPLGTSVNGYRIERVLGSGGFGVTYLACDLLMQRFAVKEYYPRQFAIRQDLSVSAASAEDAPLFEECRERFLREAQALVLLSRVAGAGDGIVRVQTYFEAHGTCFLVMDYVEGTNLASILRQEPGGLAATRVHSLLSQLLSAIRVVHEAGLMHRDIKPANIILRDDDRLVLIDFGSSRQATRSDITGYTQIYSGGYAPPEQMLGLPQAEFSDIYAIGAVCYRAIGGTLVDALSRQNALAAGRPDPMPTAQQIGAGRYPETLLAAIDAALAIDPLRRPQNVDGMLAVLGRDDPGGEPTVILAHRAAPAAAGSPGPRQRPRRGTWRVAAAGAGALALAGAAYFALRNPATPPPTAQEATADTPPLATPQPSVPPQGAATTPEPVAPEAAPAAAPSPPPPVEEPQREAIVAPPLAPLPAPPTEVPTPLDLARDAAGSLPCSVLHVAGVQDGLRVSGLAQASQELDRLLSELHEAGHVADDITRVDRAACTPMATLAAVVRHTWDSTQPTFAMRLDHHDVASGARLGIEIATMLPALYVDLYQVDGSVRHLARPTPSGASKPHVQWVAALPPGQRLIVAIGSAIPLDLGTRPDTEAAADYLAALQPLLQHATAPSAADLAMVTVHPAPPAISTVRQPRTQILRSDRCINIINRAQLGETLSDAELAALRTECRS